MIQKRLDEQAKRYSQDVRFMSLSCLGQITSVGIRLMSSSFLGSY